MSQQDKPNTAKQEGVGEYSVWWSKDNPTRQCTTHHNACNCREERFQKLEAALKDAVEALDRNKIWLNCQILKKWEFVRQVDGALKNELIPTYAAELLNQTEEALDRIRKVLG